MYGRMDDRRIYQRVKWHHFYTVLKRAYAKFASHPDYRSWFFFNQPWLDTRNYLILIKNQRTISPYHPDYLFWLFLQSVMTWCPQILHFYSIMVLMKDKAHWEPCCCIRSGNFSCHWELRLKVSNLFLLKLSCSSLPVQNEWLQQTLHSLSAGHIKRWWHIRCSDCKMSTVGEHSKQRQRWLDCSKTRSDCS